mmetsp:Transcript_31156/g.71783  ORF Transcript_31156/g.71783 Transcript_31156/m.71783 type:complete len:244 (-) Transcript_31156:278-1009(-)
MKQTIEWSGVCGAEKMVGWRGVQRRLSGTKLHHGNSNDAGRWKETTFFGASSTFVAALSSALAVNIYNVIEVFYRSGFVWLIPICIPLHVVDIFLLCRFLLPKPNSFGWCGHPLPHVPGLSLDHARGFQHPIVHSDICHDSGPHSQYNVVTILLGRGMEVMGKSIAEMKNHVLQLVAHQLLIRQLSQLGSLLNDFLSTCASHAAHPNDPKRHKRQKGQCGIGHCNAPHSSRTLSNTNQCGLQE